MKQKGDGGEGLPRARLRRLAVLLVGLTTSLAVAIALYQMIAHQERTEYRAATQSVVVGLQSAVERQITFLQTLTAFLEASDFVSAGEFAHFTRIDDRIRGQAWWAAVAWAPRLITRDGQHYSYPDDSGVFERDFELRPPENGSEVAAGSEAFPAVYVVPSLRRRQLAGVNLAGRPDWRAAIERAAQSERPVTVEPTRARIDGVDRPALLVLVPTRSSDVPSAFRGVVVGLYAISGLVDDYLAQGAIGSAFALDLHDAERSTFLFSTRTGDNVTIPLAPAASDEQAVVFKLGDRRFIAKVTPAGGYVDLGLWFSISVLLLGASLTWAVHSNLARADSEYERISAEVARATAELNQANSELAARSQALEKLADELRRKTHEAELADAAKTMFLAHMSHEFRTPLNAILGFSEVIERQALGPGAAKYVEYAGNIHRSGVELLTIIEDLLEMSRLELGQIRLREEVVPLARLVRDAASQLDQLRDERAVGLVFGRIETLPEGYVDQRAFRQALVILLSDAVNRAAPNTVVYVDGMLDTNGAACIIIADPVRVRHEGGQLGKAGPLDPFWQSSAYLARGDQGRGLGLVIARRLIEAHDGTIEVRGSSDGGAATIVLRLPSSRVRLADDVSSQAAD